MVSKRPVLDKKINRLRKALRNTPPTWIDLTEYLRDRGYAGSRKKANEILVAGRVVVDSHKVGRIQVHDALRGDENDKRWVPQPLLLSKYRANIVVLPEASE